MTESLSSKQIPAGSDDTSGFQLSYTYNKAGALKSVTYPSNRVVSYTFDGAGRVQEVCCQAGATPTKYASALAYTQWGL